MGNAFRAYLNLGGAGRAIITTPHHTANIGADCPEMIIAVMQGLEIFIPKPQTDLSAAGVADHLGPARNTP